MKALSNIKFPQLSGLRRSDSEKQHDDINQLRLNQNFKTISDAIHELEERPVSSQSGDSGSNGTGTSDHTLLSNRDVSNQHPISAITGLVLALGKKLDEDNALTNEEIEALIGGN